MSPASRGLFSDQDVCAFDVKVSAMFLGVGRSVACLRLFQEAIDIGLGLLASLPGTSRCLWERALLMWPSPCQLPWRAMRWPAVVWGTGFPVSPCCCPSTT